MNEFLKSQLRISLHQRLASKFVLFVAMQLIGLFTLNATLNTYEVIAGKDMRFSDIISNIVLTENADTDAQFVRNLHTSYEVGSFGIPKKIKFPEADSHISIVAAQHDGGWKASQGLAQTFVSADKRQKVFGRAVIYMRTNTPTTQKLGSAFSGDLVNIVTTEGWQLGYRVDAVSDDPAKLSQNHPGTVSEIIVIQVQEKTHKRTCFRAELTKVGERI